MICFTEVKNGFQSGFSVGFSVCHSNCSQEPVAVHRLAFIRVHCCTVKCILQKARRVNQFWHCIRRV